MALGDILSQIDTNTMILLAFFVITFAMIMFILRRTPLGKNNTIATVIALTAALLAMYGLNKTDFDLQFQLYQLGLTDEILYIATPILALLFIFFLSRKKDPVTEKRRFSFSRFFLILGAICFALGFMPFIYQKAFMITVGAILMAIGEYIRIRKKKMNNNLKTPNNPNTPNGPNKNQLRKQGIAALTNAAIQFKKWALSQRNPKFVGNWVNFINYLKNGRWGRNEREIVQRLNITRRDLIRTFNKYGRV